MLLISGGTIVDPHQEELLRRDILIHNGKIIKIAEDIPSEEGMTIIDAAGKKIGPGLVDVHVHFRDPGFTYKEDIETGAKAAAKGGFTAVVLMANTKPAVDNEETLSYVIQKGKQTNIHVHTCATITAGLQGEKLTDMSALYEKGAVGFTDDGIPIMSAELVKKAMEEAAKLQVPLSFHEEDPAYIQNNGINHGKASAHFGIGGSDRMAEVSLVKRDLELALETGAVFNVQHISAGESVELVRQAKQKAAAKGQYNIHAEATPHHFTLTEEAAIVHGTLAKMNPPLREEADRRAVIEGLADGTIDLIATDHAPHSKEEKERPVTEAPSGIIGLETAFALAITSLVKPGYLTLPQLFDRMSLAPARMYHLPYGELAEGNAADLIIFDDEEQVTFDQFVSRSSNSPFLGQTFYGKIEMTICDGKVVYRRNENERKDRKEKIMAQKKKVMATVFRQDIIAEGIYDMWIETDLAKDAKPGQFISVYPKNQATLLPRPISICEVNKEKTMLRIVYRVAGKGTAEFSGYRAGTKISILGTLGNGFPLDKAEGKRVFLMGGGIGIPPMLQLAKELNARKEKAAEISVVLGYRNELFLYEDFKSQANVYVATEDGSAGSKGTVMDAIKDNDLKGDIIFACGPMPMLRAIKQFAEANQMEAYISLEERMACGVGACLGCVCTTKEIDHHSHVHNARICTDGPVYNAEEVMI